MKYELIKSTEDTITVMERPNFFAAMIGMQGIERTYKHENEVYKRSQERVWYDYETGKQMDGNAELDALYRKSNW